MNVNAKLWHEVFDRDQGYCRYCHADLLASFSAFCSADVDHLLARSMGGGDTSENLVLACRGCNTCLSRAGHLCVFEDRKAYVEAQRAKGMGAYAKLVEKHRK